MCWRRVVRTVVIVIEFGEEAIGRKRRLACLTIGTIASVVLAACGSGSTDHKVPPEAIAQPCRPAPGGPDESQATGGIPGRSERAQRHLPDRDHARRLRAAGVTNPGDLDNNEGNWTWTLCDGRYTMDQLAPQVTDHVEGSYSVADDRVTFDLSSWEPQENLVLTFVSQLTGQMLTLLTCRQDASDPARAFPVRPWTKIG